MSITDGDVSTSKEYTSQTNPVYDYRNKHKILYRLRTKYKDAFEFDRYKRSIYIIQQFAKKYVLFNVVNMSKEEISKINGINRFRCIVYDIPEYFISKFLDTMNEFEAKKFVCESEDDVDVKYAMIITLVEARKKYITLNNIPKYAARDPVIKIVKRKITREKM